MLWDRRDRSEEGLSGSMCIAVSCKIHQAESHPRHVKYSAYSGKWGIDLLYYIWISVFQIRVWESISKSVEVNLISNVTVGGILQVRGYFSARNIRSIYPRYSENRVITRLFGFRRSKSTCGGTSMSK